MGQLRPETPRVSLRKSQKFSGMSGGYMGQLRPGT